jgi:hypothetical protein
VPYEPERLPEIAAQIPGPIAWEAPDRSFLGRLFGTLRSSFEPLTTMQAVSSGSVAAALRFSLIWTLPWMPLWAIMPFTHSLLFKHSFTVEVLHGKTSLSVPWDIARAGAIGIVLSSIGVVSWGLPFASLLRAFANNPAAREAGIDPGHAAWRLVLYRTWVVPCGLSLLTLVAWSLPPEPSTFVIELSLLAFRWLPRILVLMHFFSMARYFGVAGLASIAVAGVPFVLEGAVGMWVGRGAELFLPDLPPGGP